MMNAAGPSAGEAVVDGAVVADGNGGAAAGLAVRERDLRIGLPPLRLAESALRGTLDAVPEDAEAADAETAAVAAAETSDPRGIKARFNGFLRRVLPGRVVDIQADTPAEPETAREKDTAGRLDTVELRRLERQAEARAKQMQPMLFRQARSRLDGRPLSGSRP